MPARSFPLRPAVFFLGLGLLAYAGCSSGGSTSVAVTHPTMIEVAPETFLGDVPCSSSSRLRRYVATLIDTNYVAEGGAGSVYVTGEAGEASANFQLPSSLPTPCLAGVGFGLVVAGRHYDVQIDGYDTDDIAPRATGSREMVSPAPTTAEPVTPLATPRWTATCRDTVAVPTTIVRANHCTPFMPMDAAAPGSVHVALGQLLAGLSCGSEPGQVDHFEVSLDVGSDQPLTRSVPCGEAADAVFEGIAPRTRTSAYVAAVSAQDTEAFAGATCNALTLPDAVVEAECAALSQVGTLRIDLQAALQLVPLSCSASSISQMTLELPGAEPPVTLVPPDCRQPFEHGFAPGPVVVDVTAMALDAGIGEQALTCHAQVTPGQLVVAECERN